MPVTSRVVADKDSSGSIIKTENVATGASTRVLSIVQLNDPIMWSRKTE